VRINNHRHRNISNQRRVFYVMPVILIFFCLSSSYQLRMSKLSHLQCGIRTRAHRTSNADLPPNKRESQSQSPSRVRVCYGFPPSLSPFSLYLSICLARASSASLASHVSVRLPSPKYLVVIEHYCPCNNNNENTEIIIIIILGNKQ